MQSCFQSWRDGAWWNELWATYEQGSARASGGLADFAPAQVVKARRTVLETLTRLARDGDEWIPIDGIADHLHNRDEEFLVDRETAERVYGSGYYYSYPRVANSPYLYNNLGWVWEKYSADSEAGWDAVETVFIRSVLAEGLYWLGLLDLGYMRSVTPAGGAAPSGIQAVRLTDMGRWLLLDGPRPTIPAETGRVVVQPNFHVFAFDPISDAVLARLDSFATRLKAERAVEYEITRESIYRAQQNGQQVGAIVAWLEEVTAATLPQNVGRSLDEWQAAFERIVVRQRVGWLQTATAELADALVADPGLAGAIVKRIGPPRCCWSPTGWMTWSARCWPPASCRRARRAPKTPAEPASRCPTTASSVSPMPCRASTSTVICIRSPIRTPTAGASPRRACGGRAMPAWTPSGSSPAWTRWRWEACRPSFKRASRPGASISATRPRKRSPWFSFGIRTR